MHLHSGRCASPSSISWTAITGFAIEDLDTNIYDPLCNFACPRGYCPLSACVEEITIDPTLTLPDNNLSVPGLIDLQAQSDFDTGDILSYATYSSSTELSVDFTVIGAPVSIDSIGNLSCDDIGPGTEGGVLGCIAEAMLFLLLSLGEDTSPHSTRSLASLDHHFQAHSE